MSSQNIAIVVGPNLLWSPIEENILGMNMTATNMHSSIIDILIRYADWFFPGDCEFYISTPTSPRHLNGYPASLRNSQLSLSTTRLSTTDSAVDSLSSSPTNSPKSPRGILRPKKKNLAPIAPNATSKYPITRSVSCGVFQPNVNGQELRSKSLSHQSASHEDLLSATEKEEEEEKEIAPIVRLRDTSVNQMNNEKTELTNGDSKPVIKPPRTRPKGLVLPPVMEKANQRNSIERPNFPPPERPTSAKPENSTYQQEPSNHMTNGRLVNVNDINLCISDLDNKQIRVDSLSFMDDSDFEEDDGKSPSSSSDSPGKSEITQSNQTLVNDEALGTGTPKWFDHYNGNCRQSNSIWFALEPEPKPLVAESELKLSDEDDSIFEEQSKRFDSNLDCDTKTISATESSQNSDTKKFCTIIPVGNGAAEDDFKPLYQFPPSPDATIKLRVNSNSQNTRL